MMRKSILFCFVFLFLSSCKKPGNSSTAFYYWKTEFLLDSASDQLLQQTSSGQLYIRFFDVNWDDHTHQPFPNAIIKFKGPVIHYNVTPVIYITNKTFENVADTGINSLAMHCNILVNNMALEQHINYNKIQVDCDWTLTTRNKYFNFLKVLRSLNHKQLEATIRLHQVKYKAQTGVPPVDIGVLMFYNIGTLNANLHQPNSIYNEADAEKYVKYVSSYPLKLNVALPVYSWGLQIRNGKLLQVNNKINKAFLGQNNFELIEEKNCYRAKESFFFDGIYIKQNDIFKLEETDVNSLKTAAGQLTKYLPKQSHRTIIYYELANINVSEFNAEAIKDISARF